MIGNHIFPRFWFSNSYAVTSPNHQKLMTLFLKKPHEQLSLPGVFDK